MKNSIIALWFSCFNGSLKIVTRIVLIVLSAIVYNTFVLAEVLLNNSNVWYPERLAKLVESIQEHISKLTLTMLRICTTKVFN